jgi:hypothetical protein
MKVVRRLAIAVIATASVVTAILGGFFAGAVIDYPDGGERLWRLLVGTTGVACAAIGGTCAYLVMRDLRRGSLSAQAERWTWAATGAFTLLAFASVWWFYLGVLGPLVTALFVTLARNRRRSPSDGGRAGPPLPSG